MVLKIEKVSVHHLAHQERNRRYVFRVLPDAGGVRIDKHEDGWLMESSHKTLEQARRLWAWLKKIGYQEW